MTGRLIGVGVGPGDPEHITLKALRALQEADRVFVPETDARRRAGPRGGRRRPARRRGADRAAAFAMRDEARAGRQLGPRRRGDRRRRGGGGTAAFATIGDPNLYSTFAYVAHVRAGARAGRRVETVPGITALQDLAARSGTVLAEGDERLALVPWPAGEERLRDALDGFDRVVVYKGGRHLPRVLDTIRRRGRLDGSVYGEQLGLAGEEVRPPRGDGGPHRSLSLHRHPARHAGPDGPRLRAVARQRPALLARGRDVLVEMETLSGS